jgi:phosphonate transport system substrate-binding protein
MIEAGLPLSLLALLSNPSRKFIRITLAASLVPLFFLACERPDEKTAYVDFTNTVNAGEELKAPGEDSIRIAAAAMVSPRETASYYGAMMKYVGGKLGLPVEMVQRKTYLEVNRMLEKRELDLAFVCSGPYVSGKRKFGMELLAAPMLYGKATYRAYVIVHAQSGIKDFEGLRGRSFAFTDPASNTGRLVPVYMLSRMGETPESFFGKTVFTYSHDNSIKAVSKGLVDGASVDGLIWEYYKDRRPESVMDTRIIHWSPPYGIPPVVVHPGAPRGFKERLREVFLRMHEDPEGRAILQELKIERFIVPEDSSYDSVREMQDWLEGSG